MTEATWRAEVDDDGDLLWWSAGLMDPHGWGLTADDLRCDDVGFGGKADAAYAALIRCVRDAETLAKVREFVEGWSVRSVAPSDDYAERCMAAIRDMLAGES